MQGKYILQYGYLAGWPHKIAYGLRQRGIYSVNAIAKEEDVHDLNRKMPYDRAILNSHDSKIHYYKKFLFFFELLSSCSLVHYHGATIIDLFSHHVFEGRILDLFKIPMIISFGGGDARIISIARKKNPFFYRAADEERDKKTRRWLSSISRNIRYAATDCEMKEYVEPYFEKVFTFRQPLLLDEIQCYLPDKYNTCPVILHIPTIPWAKGTQYVEAAVGRLKSEGLSFDFTMKRQLSQQEVHTELSQCDIYVDELLCGSHGVTAVESMAAGKPTITYIREDLVEKYPPDLPLVNANPDTIYAVLKSLILDAELRHEIGKKSRAYAEKYHSLDVVVSELIQIYKEIGYKGN